MQKKEPNCRDLSTIPEHMRSLEAVLSLSRTHLECMRLIKKNSHTIYNSQVESLTQQYTKQNIDVSTYLKQCDEWKKNDLTELQSAQIETIENAAHKLAQINNQILSVIQEFDENIIDDISEKNDDEIAFEMLIHKILGR